MYKLIGLAKRLPTLTHQQFSDYYKGPHAELMLAIPEVSGYWTRYLQDHTVGEPGPKGHDSIGEIYFRSLEDIERCFNEPRYLTEVREDELKLADLHEDDSTERLHVVARETLTVDGVGERGKYKYFRFLSRKPGITLDEFTERWTAATAELTARPEFQELAGRIQHNEPASGTRDPLNTGRDSDVEIDGVSCVWFRSAEDYEALINGPWGERLVELEQGFTDPERTIELFTFEYVIKAGEGD